jgi:hypothetical protein
LALRVAGLPQRATVWPEWPPLGAGWGWSIHLQGPLGVASATPIRLMGVLWGWRRPPPKPNQICIIYFFDLAFGMADPPPKAMKVAKASPNWPMWVVSPPPCSKMWWPATSCGQVKFLIIYF